ncbi:MAG: hypothetical protein JKX68_07035, partial [Flavobacteriales bacterium]|nr:hypothetical protein [Flavobacteriales bacterium]
MCGITGYIANEQLPLDEMMKVIQHRGPDALGKYETVINNKHRRFKEFIIKVF